MVNMNKSNKTVEVKAPFNFVPVSEYVYFPSWTNKISHDIPFNDGVSGEIDLTITAESPIFIRNGHTKAQAESGQKNPNDTTCPYNQFSNVHGRYFIPATSIKGEVRSILEILSFSKMVVDERARFAQREWDNKELYTLKKDQPNVHCGYLRRKSGTSEYEIVDCGKPLRISHEELDNYLKSKREEPLFANYFSRASKVDLNKAIDGLDPKTASFKYHLVEQTYKGLLNEQFFRIKSHSGIFDRVSLDEDGKISGRIVFSGQVNQWKYGTEAERKNKLGDGKFYEFVFKSPENNAKKYTVSEQTFNEYKFIYEEGSEWGRIKKELSSDLGMPVFFRAKKNEVQDFGFALLYKQPYKNRPIDLLPEKHKKYGIDLAEAIFGYTQKKEQSLKGRVLFTAAFSDNAKLSASKTLVLGQPKPSYYPIYIKQNGGAYKSYDDHDAKLSGWKRYLLREGTWANESQGPNVETTIYPLERGAIFTGKVRFHNLKEVELGALLSALTFHNNDTCFHQLGQAASFGYGKCKYEINLKAEPLNGTEPLSAKEYMTRFELDIENHGKEDNAFHTTWVETEQIKELYAIARNPVKNGAQTYMKLTMDGDNDFAEAKKSKGKAYLKPFSIIAQKFDTMPSLINEEVREAERLRPVREFEAQMRKNFEDIIQGAGTIQEKKTMFNTLSSQVSKMIIAKPLFTEAGDTLQQEIKQYLSHLDIEETKERQEKTQSEGLDISNISSPGQFFGKIKKYLRDTQQELLPPSEIDKVVKVLLEHRGVKGWNVEDEEWLRKKRKDHRLTDDQIDIIIEKLK